ASAGPPPPRLRQSGQGRSAQCADGRRSRPSPHVWPSRRSEVCAVNRSEGSGVLDSWFPLVLPAESSRCGDPSAASVGDRKKFLVGRTGHQIAIARVLCAPASSDCVILSRAVRGVTNFPCWIAGIDGMLSRLEAALIDPQTLDLRLQCRRGHTEA